MANNMHIPLAGEGSWILLVLTDNVDILVISTGHSRGVRYVSTTARVVVLLFWEIYAMCMLACRLDTLSTLVLVSDYDGVWGVHVNVIVRLHSRLKLLLYHRLRRRLYLCLNIRNNGNLILMSIGWR